MNYYFERILRKFRQEGVKKALNEVLQTPSFASDPHAEIIIVSQLHKAAILMALVALKSFVRKLPSARLELLDDGSLDKDDYLLLEQHLPGANVIKIQDVNVRDCPRGGTWERLIRIQELTAEGYVIQVDTDTLTINDIGEVLTCVSKNQAFTIGGPEWPKKAALEEIKVFADNHKSSHIQIESEKQLVNVKSIDLDGYFRGCSAFAGFPKNSNLMQPLNDFSKEMEQFVGSRWTEWGTEQFSSNVMISLCEDAVALPWPKYQNFGFPFYGPLTKSPAQVKDVSVIHFIGTNRYRKNVYRQLIKKTVAMLSK